MIHVIAIYTVLQYGVPFSGEGDNWAAETGQDALKKKLSGTSPNIRKGKKIRILRVLQNSMKINGADAAFRVIGSSVKLGFLLPGSPVAAFVVWGSLIKRFGRNLEPPIRLKHYKIVIGTG